jgi:glutathione S-transferase
MITLYGFGAAFGLPDPSPFVVKAEVLLKLSALPYRRVATNPRRAPKRKLPYIEDDGVRIADSTFIRLHLEERYGIDFDRGLSLAERGVAWAVDKMLEDHLYWIIVDLRWMDDANFAAGPAHFFDPMPAILRPLVRPAIRRLIRKQLHAHGMGRHSDDEIATLAIRAVDSVAAILGDKPFLMGERPCAVDATLLGFIGGLLAPCFTSPARDAAARQANLVAHRDRMMATFYPELSMPA